MITIILRHKYKFDRWNDVIWCRTTSWKTTTKITKIPTSSKELWKEFRNRYHTKGTKNKKVPAFQPVSEDFFIKWEAILYNAKKNLVELSLYESSKVIAKIETDYFNKIDKLHLGDYKTKLNASTNNNKFYKKQFEKKSS